MRTPLRAFVTLTLLAVSMLVGLTSRPAHAACKNQLQDGASLTETPWPQEFLKMAELPADATGAGVRVAVLDSGVDGAHPQLQGKLVEPPMDLLRSVAVPEDCVGHGTSVAGIIAGAPRSGTPFRGLAPKAGILSARVSENIQNEEGSDAEQALPHEIALAVNWAVEKGAKVINISFAYNDEPESSLLPLKNAILSAINQGVVVVAAVGNDHLKNPDSVPYPAAWPGVVGVAAIGPDSQRLEQSQVGDYVDISAPGVLVPAPVPGKGYASVSGTSYAAPFVAATAALIFDRFSGQKITGEQVVKRLLATADPAPGGRDSKTYGVGIVNPVRAVTEIIDDQPPVKAQPIADASADAAALIAARKLEERREQAWWFAGVGVILAILAVALMLALPAGLRRRWRPAGR